MLPFRALCSVHCDCSAVPNIIEVEAKGYRLFMGTCFNKQLRSLLDGQGCVGSPTAMDLGFQALAGYQTPIRSTL